MFLITNLCFDYSTEFTVCQTVNPLFLLYLTKTQRTYHAVATGKYSRHTHAAIKKRTPIRKMEVRLRRFTTDLGQDPRSMKVRDVCQMFNFCLGFPQAAANLVDFFFRTPEERD